MDHEEHSRKSDAGFYRWLKVLAVTTLVLTCVLLGLLTYWSLYPYEPVKVLSEIPLEIVSPKDKVTTPGGSVTYEFRYEKYDDRVPTIERQFVDGLVFNVEDNRSTLVGVSSGVARTQVHIPETLPPGEYYLRLVATYHVNPIRDWKLEVSTERFTVVPPEDCDEEGL